MADAVARAIVEPHHLMVEAGTGVGKALSLDSPIPTPAGWTTTTEGSINSFVSEATACRSRIRGMRPKTNATADAMRPINAVSACLGRTYWGRTARRSVTGWCKT